MVVIGEIIAVVIIILQINIWPETLPTDVLEKKYIKEISAGVLSSGILFFILYYFQGEELKSTQENQVDETKVATDFVKYDKSEEDIVKLTDDKGVIFHVPQKYLQPLIQDNQSVL